MTLRDRVLSILRSSPAPLTADAIADLVYADDPDGGPLTAARVVHVAVLGLRRRGHLIETARGRQGGYTYRGHAAERIAA